MNVRGTVMYSTVDGFEKYTLTQKKHRWLHRWSCSFTFNKKIIFLNL